MADMLKSSLAAVAVLGFASLAAAQAPATIAPAQAAPAPAQAAPNAPQGIQTPPAAQVALQGEARQNALGLASASLNRVSRLQGRFVQTSTDGRATGAFYLQRPGKLRFEYDGPTGMLIISDGTIVARRDRALRTTDRTLLRATPLSLVLRSDVNLERDARIVRVARAGDWILVTARDRSGQTDGQITMQFQGAGVQLRSWEITDATGGRTRVALTDVTAPASFDRRLFRLEDLVENRPGPH